jgi:hypothetical protein
MLMSIEMSVTTVIITKFNEDVFGSMVFSSTKEYRN